MTNTSSIDKNIPVVTVVLSQHTTFASEA